MKFEFEENNCHYYFEIKEHTSYLKLHKVKLYLDLTVKHSVGTSGGFIDISKNNKAIWEKFDNNHFHLTTAIKKKINKLIKLRVFG
jgi:hypothetical protein